MQARRARFLVAAAFGFTAGGILLSASSSEAFTRRIHASACMLLGGSVTDSVVSSGSDEGVLAGLHSNHEFTHLLCPVPDDTSMTKDLIATTNVYIRREETGFEQPTYIKTCRTHSTQNSGACGTASIVSNFASTGNYTISPDVSGWPSTGFGYLYLRLSGGDELRGFTVQD